MRCECVDILCPCHDGMECRRDAVVILTRVDMEDHDGTAFCEDCSLDAVESGLFDTGVKMTEAEILRALAVVKSQENPPGHLTLDECLDRILATIKSIIGERRANGAR